MYCDWLGIEIYPLLLNIPLLRQFFFNRVEISEATKF